MFRDLFADLCAERVGICFDRNAGAEQDRNQKARDNHDPAQKTAADHPKKRGQDHTEHAAADVAGDAFGPCDRELCKELLEIIGEGPTGRSERFQFVQRFAGPHMQRAEYEPEGEQPGDQRAARRLLSAADDQIDADDDKHDGHGIGKAAVHAEQVVGNDLPERIVRTAVQPDGGQHADRKQNDADDLDHGARRALFRCLLAGCAFRCFMSGCRGFLRAALCRRFLFRGRVVCHG